MPRFDALNIIGIHELLNPQHVDKTKSAKSVEEEVTGRAVPRGAQREEVNPVNAFQSELKELAGTLGVDLEGDETEADTAAIFGEPAPAAAPAAAPATSPPAQRPAFGHDIGVSVSSLLLSDSEDESPAAGHGSGSAADRITLSETGSDGTSSDSDEASSSDDNSSSDETDDGDDAATQGGFEDASLDALLSRGGPAADIDSDAVLGDLGRKLGIDFSEESFRSSRRVPAVPAPGTRTAPSIYDSAGRRRHQPSHTAEQERRRHIDSVLGDLRTETHTVFGAQREREQDIKASKIEQIGQLRIALEEDGIDCEAVGNPTPSSSMEDIDSVLRILRLKNDRNRCASLAEEVILGAAEMIETVFDGTRAIPLLGWKPDYTGYHNTVNVKMHRMRYETASVVSGIIEKHQLGPMSRIGLELLPSLLLYPRQNRRQLGRPSLADDPSIGRRRVGDARNAYSAIRARDAPGEALNSRVPAGTNELMDI